MTSVLKHLKKSLSAYDPIIIALLIVSFALTTFYNVWLNFPSSPFFDLAQQALHGRLDLPSSWLGMKDTATYQGLAYWPLGPFPIFLYLILILVTGVQTDTIMSDSVITVLVALGIALVIFRIARAMGYGRNDALWSLFAYLFASPLLAIVWAPRPHYVAHLIVALILPAAYLAYQWSRFRSVGWLYAIAAVTRLTSLPTMLAYVFMTFWDSSQTLRSRLVSLTRMCIPIALMGFLLALYNYLRFHDPFEFGYGIQLLGADLQTMRDVGVFSLKHIPGNLYYFLISPPLFFTMPGTALGRFPYLYYSWWGVGMVYTSPYLFALLWRSMKERLDRFMIGAAIITAVPIMCYYGVGAWQLGYRYGLDFFPLLFIVFLRSIYRTESALPMRFKALFVVVFVLNAYLFFVNHLPGLTFP